MTGRERDPKIAPLQGVLHPPCFEECPPPPDFLDEPARALWRKIAPDMHARCILTVVDVPCLAVYCTVVAHAAELDAAGETAEAAEFWHEADERAAMLMIDPPTRSKGEGGPHLSRPVARDRSTPFLP